MAITEKYARENAHCLPMLGKAPKVARLYKPRVVTKICDLLVKGESTNKICKRKGMPSRVTLGKWLVKYPDFAEKYLQAKQIQTYFNVDDIKELADDCDGSSSAAVAKAKLQVDARKWEASKMVPKIYGDKASLNIRDEDKVDMSRMAEVVENVMKKLQPSEEVIEGEILDNEK